MRILFLLSAFLVTNFLYSQSNIIKIKNRSFEGKRVSSEVPSRWIDVGSIYFKGESPCDIQPGSWDVELKPKDGKSYVGMVVRDVETFEAIGQKLTKPMKANKSYNFSLDISKSSIYNSKSQITGDDASYTGPTVLRIIGADKDWQNRKLLATSPIIDHFDWKKYKFILYPYADIEYIILEVYWSDPKAYYNGHILIDNASDLVEIDH